MNRVVGIAVVARTQVCNKKQPVSGLSWRRFAWRSRSHKLISRTSGLNPTVFSHAVFSQHVFKPKVYGPTFFIQRR